jgi:pimeloyl-ACP methyl ester carboxylesterase
MRLFIHGGSHGAWCWQPVIDVLEQDRSDGTRNVAFDLPGCGADPTPRDQVNLQAQVDRVLAVMDRTADTEVALVGHSIAGWLLAEVAARRPARVTRVHYIAAVVLEPGQRGIDVIPESRRGGYFEMARDSEDFSIFVSFADARRRFFNHLDVDRARAAYDRLTRQPFGPYLDPVSRGPADLDCPISYLALEDDRTFTLAQAGEFARRLDVEPVVAPGDHCVMLSDPAVVADFVRS